MKINKALKKEKRNNKIFFVFMSLLFIFLPIIAVLSQNKDLFFIIYLVIIETLIIIELIKKTNYNKLKFYCSNSKLKIKSGLFKREVNILCDKIALVHTIKSNKDIKIILISTSRFRNKNFKKISKEFLKNYSEASEEYLKIKKLNPEENYYFLIIKYGGLKKYILQDTIYINCVKASYTSSAIENIKVAREQVDLY